MNGSEAAGDLVLIQTSLFYHVNRVVVMLTCLHLHKKSKLRGLYQNKVTASLASSHKPGNSATTVKWSISYLGIVLRLIGTVAPVATAHAFCTSQLDPRNSGFLWTVPINTKVLLRGLGLCERVRF